ncbi:MAG: alpha/beta fold hydrolase [Terriglobales bacterium]
MPEFADGFDSSLVDEMAVEVGPSGMNLTYQRIGKLDAPVVLLIMGVAGQSIHWPDVFCQALVDRGLQVIRFDNRDAGLSTHLTDAPPPNLPAALAGDLTSVSYTLSHMAGDAVGLLDALGVDKAHIVGASMGGQIAQTMAIEHPDRVLSLTSMMSTTGNMSVGQPSMEMLRELFAGPPAVTRDEVIQQSLRAMRVVGSPGYPSDEAEVAARAGRAYDRSHDPIGSARQAIATVASGDRTERLRHLQVPTLVIHGLADRMRDVSGGRATGEVITGAELVLIEGMGHDLPPGLRPLLATRIAEFVWHVENRCEEPRLRGVSESLSQMSSEK